jgi:hypothetical protein
LPAAVECRLIDVTKPQGLDRRFHRRTTIELLDAPTEVPAKWTEEVMRRTPAGWLFEQEVPDSTSIAIARRIMAALTEAQILAVETQYVASLQPGSPTLAAIEVALFDRPALDRLLGSFNDRTPEDLQPLARIIARLNAAYKAGKISERRDATSCVCTRWSQRRSGSFAANSR